MVYVCISIHLYAVEKRFVSLIMLRQNSHASAIMIRGFILHNGGTWVHKMNL